LNKRGTRVSTKTVQHKAKRKRRMRLSSAERPLSALSNALFRKVVSTFQQEIDCFAMGKYYYFDDSKHNGDNDYE